MPSTVRSRCGSASLDEFWPCLPEGNYWGVARRVEVGRAPSPPRRARAGESEEDRRQDWHVYVHVELVHGATAKTDTAIQEYSRQRGRFPVTYYPCRFDTRKNETAPLPLRRSMKLYQLLRLVSGTRDPQAVPFDAVIGWMFLVRLRTVKEDWAGDQKPEQLWRSVVDKILEARSPRPPSSESSVSSNQQVAVSNKQPPQPGYGGESGEKESGGWTGVGLPVTTKQPTNRRGDGSPNPSTPAADARTMVADVVSASGLDEQGVRRRLAERFGRGAEVAPRGPCQWCHGMTYGRPGESGWCPRCD